MNRVIGCLAISCLCFLLFTHCADDSVDPGPQEVCDTQDTTGAYMPLTTGTYWRHDSDGVRRIVLADSVFVGGLMSKQIAVISLTTGDTSTHKTYYAIKNGIHYHMYYGHSIFTPIYKEGAAVGQSWTINYSGGTTMVGTLLEKDIERTLGGKTYKKVVHTGVETFMFGTSVGYTHHYLAKGVGDLFARISCYHVED